MKSGMAACVLAVLVLAGACNSPAPTATSVPAARASAMPKQERIAVPEPHGYLMRDLRPGDTFSDGWETLHISGRTPIVIENVRTIGGRPGLRQIGVKLAGDDRKVGSIQSSNAYPPVERAFGTLQNAIGATISPRPGPNYPQWELVVGYKVVRPGVWTRKGVAITYRDENGSHTVTFPAELVVCTIRARGCRNGNM